MSKERKDVNLKGRLGIFDNTPTPLATDKKAIDDKPIHHSEIIVSKEKSEDEEIPKLKGINVKLYPNLHKEYKKHCIEKGQTIQDHVVSLIKKELKKNK